MRRVLVAAGLVLVVAALLWRPVAVPLLVRFPTDLDQATRYEGTFTLYVDQETGASLAEPVRLPLEIERRIRTVPGESSADTVVLQELVTFRVSGIDQHETHQYVMDRRSMQNQDDPRSWSYSPGNVVDRAGTYRVNLALGTDGEHSYRVWENEPGAGFSMAGEPGGRPTSRHGLTLLAMEEVFGDVPVTAAYRQELRRQGFPLALTLTPSPPGWRATGSTSMPAWPVWSPPTRPRRPPPGAPGCRCGSSGTTTATPSSSPARGRSWTSSSPTRASPPPSTSRPSPICGPPSTGPTPRRPPRWPPDSTPSKKRRPPACTTSTTARPPTR